MALGQYLGGTALIIFGAFLLLIGIFAMLVPGAGTVCCAISCLIGIVLILIGGFYQRIAHQNVPTKVEVMGSSKADRYCPNCGRAIPFDANVCPYCEKRF